MTRVRTDLVVAAGDGVALVGGDHVLDGDVVTRRHAPSSAWRARDAGVVLALVDEDGRRDLRGIAGSGLQAAIRRVSRLGSPNSVR